MLKRKIKDENIRDFLKEVDLEHLADREGGLDSDVDWKDVLSGKLPSPLLYRNFFVGRYVE